MTAKIKCLHCGKAFNYFEFQMDDELREIIKLLPKFGGYQHLVMEYVELFGVTPLRMKTSKVLRLLGQVATIMEKEQFDFGRKVYKISKRGIAEALNITCNRPFNRPLSGHNYLKEVMISISEREQREHNVEREKALRKKEDLLKTGVRADQESSEEGQEEISAGDWKRKKGIESLANNVGKTLE